MIRYYVIEPRTKRAYEQIQCYEHIPEMSRVIAGEQWRNSTKSTKLAKIRRLENVQQKYNAILE